MFDIMLNAILSPVLNLNPVLGILLIGSLISGSMTLINKKALESEEAKKLRKKIQKIRADLLEAQKSGDTKKVEDLSTNMMQINTEYLSKNMKYMVKPLIISILLAISVIPWLQKTYGGKTIASIPEIFPIVGGFNLSWVSWYILCTLTVSIVLRKILGE